MDALRKIPSLLARQRRRNAAAAALRLAGFLASAHLGALAVLGYLSVRHPLSPVWLEAMGWTYVTYVLLPFVFWARWRASANSKEEVAQALDRANPSAPDPFRASLSLGNHDEATLTALDRSVAEALPSLRLPRPAFSSRLQRALLVVAGALFVVAAVAAGRPLELARRAALPWLVLERLPILRFRLAETPAVAGVGDTVKVRGAVENRQAGQELYAYVRTSAGEVRYPLPAQGDSFAFAYGPVESDLVLQFAAANGGSDPLRIRVLPAPFLEKLQAVLAAPGYTGLKSDTLPMGVAHFSVLPGTRVTWRVSADRDLKGSEWEFDSITHVTLGPGRDFVLSREVRAPLAYSYRLEDGEGIRSRPFPPYRIDITPDQPPEVEWTDAGAASLDRSLKLPLSFRVKDDYGVSSLKLVYRILGSGGVRSEGRRDCRDWLKQAAAGLVQAEWDVTDLGLRPENALEFRLVATDNDTINGPKAGQSTTRTVRLPTVQEILAATRQKEQSAVANLKSAIQREKQIERKLERENPEPHDEAPPMLADYEINRIMVDDPRSHARRTEALLTHAQQALSQMAKGGSRKDTPSSAEIAQAQAGLKDLREAMKRGESSLPLTDQARLPLEERAKNLDKLLQAQQDEAEKMSKALGKLAKAAGPKDPRGAPDLFKPQFDEAAKELQRNIDSQTDLKKFFQDQAAQAKAKTEMAEQAGQEQSRMAEDVKTALEDIQKAVDQGMRNGTLSKELVDKMKKVQDLMREVLPDSLQKMLQQKASGQEIDPREMRDQLGKMMGKQGELSENLTRALAMLEQLRDRKRMEDLKQQLASLEAREDKLAHKLSSGAPGKSEEEEQKAIQKETQKALEDFSAQAAGKKDLQEADRMLQSQQVGKDMQAARDAMASSSGGKSKGAPSRPAASAARSAASKLGAMASALGESLASMDNGLDISEADEILEESLALSRWQILIGSGAARRQAEGWDAEEASLYASLSQTASWIHERVKAMAAKTPFAQGAILSEARGLAKSAGKLASQYAWEDAQECLQHNQDLSRELLKLIKMAQSSPAGGGGGGGGGSSSASGGQGSGGSKGGGSLSSQLKGMSGKQMAINSATYQLLQAMLEGRRPGPQGSGSQGPGSQGSGGDQSGSQSGDQPGGSEGAGAGQGQGGQTLPGMGNREGELGESLESLAEGMDDGGGAAEKVRRLAEDARKLEDDLRQGRITAEELRQRQERFQTRLLEASTALEERGMSEKREAEAAHGAPTDVPSEKAMSETRLLQLLREARKESKTLRLSESQRKFLDEYYDNLLTR